MKKLESTFQPVIRVAAVFLFVFLIALGTGLACSDDKNMALINAALRDDLGGINNAIEAGADVNFRYYSVTVLTFACNTGNIEITKLLLEKGAAVNAQSDKGRTPLMWAARNGHLDVVNLLLEKGADINACSGTGETALIHASTTGRAGAVKQLLEKGADVNVVEKKDGQTALMDASRPGHFEVVKLLLSKGAAVHAENDRKVTALGMASLKDQTRVLGLLSESGAKNKGIGYDRMALLGAAFDNDVRRVRVLIEKGVDASLKGEALMSASFFGSTDLVKMLLEKGADVNTKDSKGQTALEIATIINRTDVIELLKAHGAK